MRAPWLIVGGTAIVLIWFGPLPALARGSFTAHMLLHMGVVTIAAPAVALGLAGSRFDPADRYPRLCAPVPASIYELVIVWAWHAPALHHAARTSTTGFVLEQGSFFLAALLVWISACGGGTARVDARAAAGVVALLLTSMHVSLLGALLALAPRPLYSHGTDAPASALTDQHLGGAIMLMLGGTVYLAGGLWLASRLLIAPAGNRERLAPREST